jgi:hypothetical protein
MTRYMWLFAEIVLAACGVLGLVVYWVRRRSGNTQRRSWLSYALLWPAILDADKEGRNGRLFTGREWLGWLVVGVLMLVGYLIGNHVSRS